MGEEGVAVWMPEADTDSPIGPAGRRPSAHGRHTEGTLARYAARPWDVVVIGGGNAALVAAITARHTVRRVLLIERSPEVMRGGNTRHTRNIRCVHPAADDYYTGAYLAEELWRDLCGVGEGPSNEHLARLTVQESESMPGWMCGHGIRWQKPLSGTLSLGRTNRFFLGGGKALVNAYNRTAARMGIEVVYDACVTRLEFDGPLCTGLIVRQGGAEHRITATSVICASGGFEANIDWLRDYWGDAAGNYRIRGTPYNDGLVLAELLRASAATAGQEKGFHAVAIDARAPRFDGGIATRLDCIPFGIVVNRRGRRFYDEGEDIWPKRYAMWGRHIAEQPDQLAYCLWDSKVAGRFLPPMYGVTPAPTIRELARNLALDEDAVGRTVAEYNGAIQHSGTFDPQRLDDCTAAGIDPPKSHWAQRLDSPPYFGIAMRPGITFTYLGVAVNSSAHVLRQDGSPFRNVFACGEIMSGNILSTGYLAGFGMTIGSVWGRIAGAQAASHAH
jgi:tricarballylate dehydrogenase